MKFDFAGVKVDNLTIAEATAQIITWLEAKTPRMIVTPNPEIIVACQTDPELMTIINQADLAVPDGISMVVVSRILGRPLKERVSGIDLMLDLLAKVAPLGKKVFLLGSAPEVAEAAKLELEKRFSGLDIVGAENGYFSDDLAVINKINVTRTDLLFVGLGAGRQELWLNRYLKTLNIPVCMVIGGSLDVISGRKKRAPRWARALYIEWLYRLVTEPNRWKRQIALPKFLWLMFWPH
ncbi:WecB/TagA/CpsF family glycosyltransferase [Candidatus Saganbacteria bacterium]|nr:WecB/TagA/CpsF family glycosyltransferase [Candidatus Saganbacteria bacterium]